MVNGGNIVRNLILCLSFIFIIAVVYSQTAYSVCVGPVGNIITCNTNPPNPDINGVQQGGNANNLTVNVLVNAEVITQGQPGILHAIRTGEGNDNLNITFAVVRGEDIAINSAGGEDTIKVIGSEITAIERTIESGNGADTVMIENSTIESQKEIAIQTGNENDNVMVTGSTITGVVNDGIETANQNDQVTIEDSVISGGGGFFAVDLGNGNDTLTIKTGADLRGGIDCRDDDDTLIFAMEVPQNKLNAISIELATKDPFGDSITINGLLYEWQECEEIENQLEGAVIISNVPTISQWGLLATAVVLGFIGLVVVRRKSIRA